MLHGPYHRRSVSYSSITSREKSALRSAPQTDHRFRSLLLRKVVALDSRELLRLVSRPSGSPISALYLRSSSAAMRAASSASGVSSIVSSELIDGDRDLNELGVLGMLDTDPKELGYGSFE